VTDLQITDVTATPEYQRLKEDFIRVEMSRSHWENMARNYEKQHIDDIHKIGQALINEATTRDWCDLYDEFVDDLNKELHRPLDVRQHSYSVEVEYTVKIHREIEATKYDDALDSLREDVEREIGAIDDVDYDFVRAIDYT
jgi:hypothetical protein